MSKYNLVGLLKEYVGGAKIGTYPVSAMQLVRDMEDLEKKNSNIEVRRTDGSGDGKVSITYTVVEKGQDPGKQERGFTVYDYKIGDWVDERGEYEGAMDEKYAEKEVDFSIGGNDIDLALKLLPGATEWSVEEGTCGYDRDAKTGKKLKGPGGLGKVNENIYVDGDEVKMHLDQYRKGNIDGDDLANAFEEILFGAVKPPTGIDRIEETLDKEAWGKLERLQHAIDDPDYIINSMMRAMSTDDANLYLDAMIRDHIDIIDDEEALFGVEESTGPSDKAETEDDVVNVDKVAGPSAKGVGYGAETSANTAEDDQEDKEIQNPPPMYSMKEDMSLTNLAKKLGIDVDDLKDRIKKLQSTEKDKIEADAYSKSAIAEAKDWIQKAIKRPGALHRALDIPQDEDIPHSLIDKDIRKMDDLEDEEGHLDKRDLRFLRQLDLAKTLEKFNEGEEAGKLDRVEDVINTLGDDDIEKIVAYMKERGRIEEKDYHETESYADYEDIAQAYMEAHQYRRRMLRMSNKQLETLGKRIVDDKYDGDVGKAYDEIVLSDYKPVKKYKGKTMYSDKVDENGDVEDFTDELKEDKDEYKLRKQVVNLVMKEKSVPISIAQEFFETHYDDIIDMNSDEILDEFDEYASVNFDSVPMQEDEDEMEKLREHFKRFI